MEEQARSFARGVTVDGPTSKDLDDAIHVERTGEGWNVQVSIADVSAGVPKGGSVDLRAFEQAFTRYYARGNRPMLPRSLADEQLSLLPNRKRNTITFFMTLDASLDVKNIEIRRSWLESSQKLTHARVDEILDTTDHVHHGWWSDCYELAQRLLRKRRDKGALAVFDLKKGLTTDEEGKVTKMPTGQYYRAYLIVQELMILANHAVTTHLHAQGVPLLFRNHTTRQEDVRAHFMEELARLLVEPTPELLGKLEGECRHLMNRARYGPVLEGHFALNLDAYAHWTSPIRRYADLVNHRMLVAWLEGSPMPYSHEELAAIGEHLNAISDEVRDGTRDVFRDKQIERLSRLNGGALRRLPYGDFRYFVEKLTDGTIPLDEPRARVVADWILDRSANVVDIARILFTSVPQDPSWVLVKEAALQWLQSDPAQVFSVINMAHEAYGTPSTEEVTNVYEQIGKRRPIHRVTVSMTLGERAFTSETFDADTRKKADQLATMSLLIAIAELPTPFTPRRKNDNMSGTGTANPKGFLLERCTKLGIANPTFEEKEEGPSHTRTFICTATLTFRSQVYTSGPLKAASKKSAQREAALELLSRLPEEFTADAPASEDDAAPTSDSAANPIGALQEYAQKRGLAVPDYRSDSSGPPHARIFKCVCMLRIRDEEKTWTGVGGSKAAAKADAATRACKELKI